MKFIPRLISPGVSESLENFQVVAVIGPRQCGKSTLVKHLLKTNRELLYLDLERPSDLKKLDEAEWFFISQKEKLICLDKVQRKSEIFPVIRSLVDEWGEPGHFLILGSASRDLLKQSSESLAGRIRYKQLTPLLWNEIRHFSSIEEYLTRGGFPASLLAKNKQVSFEWRDSFISTFLERDLLQWTNSSPVLMGRLWQMLAHLNGQILNQSALANSLGVSNTSIRNYIDILHSTFMLDILQPHIANTGKRLIKSPKVYLTDSGIITALLGLKEFHQLSGHPVFGSLWEGMVLTNLRGYFPDIEIRYYRTNHGSEIDFMLVLPDKLIAIECKAGMAPSLTRGTYAAIDDLKPENTFIVAPVKDSYSVAKKTDVVNLEECIERLQKIIR